MLEFCHSWAALDPTLLSLFGDGSLFCAELRIKGTITQAVEGIPVTSIGRYFDFAEADVFRVEGEVISGMTITRTSLDSIGRSAVEQTLDSLGIDASGCSGDSVKSRREPRAVLRRQK